MGGQLSSAVRHHHMNNTQNIEIAENTFSKIIERFPFLKIERNEIQQLDLNIDIPVQTGLKYKVNLNLQNMDELHFTVENFWIEYFPCSEQERVERFIDAVSGFLSGKYRIFETYRWKKCVKAELQMPIKDGNWKTIGISSHIWFPFPFKKTIKIVANA